DLFLGIMYAGRVVSPVNLLAQPAQLAYVLDHSDARLVFVAEAYREQLEQAHATLAHPAAVETIDVDAEELFPELGESAAPPDVREDDTALLMYTSGTTGRPKGALLTHRNVVAGGRYTS